MQKKDKRIIVLNEPNSGQGSARNRGLEIARGKYIQFLDSDDYYEPNCCEEMYNLMEKHNDIDVACFDTNIVYEAYFERKEEDEKYFNMSYIGKQKIKQSMISTVDCDCWNKIFRKSFIDTYNLRFPEKLHYEDYGFFWFWVTRAKKIYFYPEKLTNYLRREGSFLGEIFEKRSKIIFDDFKIFEIIYNDLTSNNKWESYKQTYIKRYLNNFRWLINCFSNENWKDRENLVNLCNHFLSKINTTGIFLENWENILLNNIRNKNYFSCGAYQTFTCNNVHPVYRDNSINIVFSTDKDYIPYLGVTIQSIVDNASLEYNYDIIVLSNGIYDYQKRFLLFIAQNKNISIRFVNMADYIKKFGSDKFYAHNHITTAAYFRLFVGKIFKNYEKILYLDCDLITTSDISQLFFIDIKDYPIAAVKDTVISSQLPVSGINGEKWCSFREYMHDTLDFTNVKNYFNSGVMLIDIKKYNAMDFDYLIDLAKRNNRFFHDQNVLNAAFEDNYFMLPNEWNFQWNIKFHCLDGAYKNILSPDDLMMYESYEYLPKIIHYTSHEKPWKNPHHTFANIWWEYARRSPFYEIILKGLYGNSAQKNISSCWSENSEENKLLHKLLYRQKKRNYLKYKILSHLTFGATRRKYKQKKHDLKWWLKNNR